MTTTPAAPLRTVALGDMDAELQSTRRALDAIPDESLGFRPHERSFTLGELATHLVTIPFWGVGILRDDTFDLATLPRDRNAAMASKAAILAKWDETAGVMRDALGGVSDEALLRTWTLKRGDQVVMSLPRAAALRSMVLSHMVHHRGQLTLYLRLAGAKVPGLYGPSSDDAPRL